MARSTGIGSMPGTDLLETSKIAFGEAEDLPFLPELPARGPHAAAVGRTLAMIGELGADLQPDGWRIGVGQGVDQRRARSLLAQDLDVVEELAHEHDGPLKVQVVGPWTLAASVEHPRGEKMLADHGARRELGEALSIGLADHLADVRRRFPRAQLVAQVDEPGLRAVLDGTVPTASGYRRLRSVDLPEVDALLRPVVEVITAANALPVVHSCAPRVPVGLLRGAGFRAVAVDLSLVAPDDAWGEAFDTGTDLWLGAVPSTDPSSGWSPDAATTAIERFFGALGFEPVSFADRLVVTPACGLAGATPAWSRAALAHARSIASRFA